MFALSWKGQFQRKKTVTETTLIQVAADFSLRWRRKESFRGNRVSSGCKGVRNIPHRLSYLNTWSLAVGEELHH